jgi:hypothetical protein
MEALCASETSVKTRATQWNAPENILYRPQSMFLA